MYTAWYFCKYTRNDSIYPAKLLSVCVNEYKSKFKYLINSAASCYNRSKHINLINCETEVTEKDFYCNVNGVYEKMNWIAKIARKITENEIRAI